MSLRPAVRRPLSTPLGPSRGSAAERHATVPAQFADGSPWLLHDDSQLHFRRPAGSTA